MAEKFKFKFSERDNRCAVIKVLIATNFELCSAEVSCMVDVPVSSVKDIRSQLNACEDVSMVLERMTKDQEDARKVKSEAWVKKLQDLIDLHMRAMLCLLISLKLG